MNLASAGCSQESRDFNRERFNKSFYDPKLVKVGLEAGLKAGHEEGLFRHQSWFAPAYREKTLGYMREEGWIHSICDEPQAGAGSIPIVLEVTDKAFTLVRLHGRNDAGWNGNGRGDANGNWREVRYLYDYKVDELSEWKDRLMRLLEECSSVGVIFNK